MGRLEDAYNQARNGLLPLGDILPNVLPPAALKPPARSRTAEDQSELCFQHSVFCQTGLPYRDPSPERRWTRRQGRAVLEIEAGRIPDPRTGQ